MITRNTWMLASALLLAAACSDDDEPGADVGDGGRDATVPDAGNMDAGHDAGNIDANLLPEAGPDDAASDATGGDGSVSATLPQALLGKWYSAAFMYEEEITATVWGGNSVVLVDTANRVAVVQIPADDPYSPNKFSKVVWTPIDSASGGFYYCTHEYGKNTIAEALATMMNLDASMPATGGCGDGNFKWTDLSPALELSGTWQSAGSTFEIDSQNFGTYGISSYDNASDTAVLSSGGGDAGAGTFSKLVWTKVNATRAYYCIVATGLATAQEALDSTATADVSMPTTGCQGASWSSLTQ